MESIWKIIFPFYEFQVRSFAVVCRHVQLGSALVAPCQTFLCMQKLRCCNGYILRSRNGKICKDQRGLVACANFFVSS